MNERRVAAVVIGPGAPGYLRVRLGDRERDVRADRLPPNLRTPNSEFVAVVEGGEFRRLETGGRPWLTIQDSIRSVLNAYWDPIGVADSVADEYDSYIGVIYSMIRQGATSADLAAHLLHIEADSMEISGSPDERRLDVARRLLALDLPSL